MNSQYFVLTRFAVKSRGTGFSGSFPPGWLDSRFDLFERYCLPTMQSQTCGDFEWLILVHKDFAKADEERLSGYDSRISVVKGRASLLTYLDPDVDVVISTRLDSDDGLHREFVHRVRSYASTFAASRHDAWLHNFPHGFKLDTRTGKGYPSYKPNSAFVSLFERPQEDQPIASALARNHSMMPDHYPTMQDQSLKAWLIVVHGGNVLNGIGAQDLSNAFPFSEVASDFGLPNRRIPAPGVDNV